jgi:PhoH-like ATPase
VTEPAPAVPARALRTYVLDTSVLLADPRALVRFDEHEVVLPIVVLMELEAKRNHPELGWAARQTLRMLEQLRTEAGSLTEPFVVNPAGGTLRVELNHQGTAGLPAALASDNNDHRILAVAKNLADERRRVTVVTKDLPLRLKASIVGLDADEYRNELANGDSSWSGFVELEVDSESIDELFAERVVDLVEARDLPCNTGVALVAGATGSQSALGRVRDDKRVHLVRGDRTLFDLHGRSAEQRIAIELLADPRVGIVSIGGPAGTGKSVIALAAGLDAVLEQRTHKRVVVFRPLYPVGGQDLGFLPGTEAEKMSPWASAVTDAL